MKKIIFIKILLLLGIYPRCQSEELCHTKKLIVAADNLNFRTAPNTNSEPICTLGNKELLTLLEPKEINISELCSSYSDSWINVKRVLTGEEGYVYSKYIKPQEMAYLNGHDSEKLQSGNWYGIYKEDNKVRIEKANPIIEESEEGFKTIQSKNKHELIICSQEQIKDGYIHANLYDNELDYIKIGIEKRLIRIKNLDFSLACVGEVSFIRGSMKREKEMVIFAIEEIQGSQRKYKQQELSNCIQGYGEIGYTLHFVGDLNNDGIPELIISEGSTQNFSLYYFKSNKAGKLELQSITESSSKC